MQLRRVRPYGEMAVLAGVYLAAAWVSPRARFRREQRHGGLAPDRHRARRAPAARPGALARHRRRVVPGELADARHRPCASVGVGRGDALECLAAVWLLAPGRDRQLARPSGTWARCSSRRSCARRSRRRWGPRLCWRAGPLRPRDAPSRWLTWCFGDAAGVILVAPGGVDLVLPSAAPARGRRGRWRGRRCWRRSLWSSSSSCSERATRFSTRSSRSSCGRACAAERAWRRRRAS